MIKWYTEYLLFMFNFNSLALTMKHNVRPITDINCADSVFTDLFRDIWTNDVLPIDCNNGIIVKLPKKGDPQYCDNCRGITLP